MNSAQNTNVSDDKKQITSAGKEKEAPISVAPENITVAHEMELSKEVEKAGVEIVKETIELPPDVKKLGVSPVGPSAPVTTVTKLPPVVLPISDQEIETGLHTKVMDSFRWLAVWCIKQLRKAHIALKNIHGKIIRVRD